MRAEHTDGFSLLEHMTDALVALDRDGRVRWLNDAARRSFPDVEGKIGWDAEPDAFAPECLRALVEQRTITVEKHFPANDAWQEMRVFPLPDGVGVSFRDITGRKRAERELRESETRYRILTEYSGVGIWQITPDGQTLYCNPAMRAMLEIDSLEEVQRHHFSVFFTEESRQAMAREHARRDQGIASTYEVEIIGARGGRRSAVISGAPMPHEKGKTANKLGTFTDITSLKQAQEARRQAEEKYRTIFENAREGLYQTSPEGRILSANPALAHILGYKSPDKMIEAIQDIGTQAYVDSERRAKFVRAMETQDGVTEFESQIYGKDRQILWISENARAIRDANGTLRHYEGSITDITQRKTLEAERAHLLTQTEGLLSAAVEQADLEPLTGLLNHRAFHRRLREETETMTRTGGQFATVILDLDNFKFFNDSYGHLAGDDVLRQVADALRTHCRAPDALARLGGDEFGLLMPGLGLSEAQAVAARLTQSLVNQGYHPFEGSSPIPLRLSAGVAVFPDEGQTGLQVLQQADERLIQAKHSLAGSGAAEEIRVALSRREGFAMLDALVTATDAKDRYTRCHSEEVMVHCLALARYLGMDDEAQETLALAALLHDIGKIGIPDAILRKPGPLTEAEYRLTKQHPSMGAAILSAAPGFEAASAILRHHHENWDGTGYPDGLQGEAIPPLARLLAIAEAFCTLTTDRAYRKAIEPEQAQAILRAGAGTQWDPEYVTAFADCEADGPKTSTTNVPGT